MPLQRPVEDRKDPSTTGFGTPNDESVIGTPYMVLGTPHIKSQNVSLAMGNLQGSQPNVKENENGQSFGVCYVINDSEKNMSITRVASFLDFDSC